MKRRFNLIFIIVSSFLLLSPMIVNAATVGFTGGDKVYIDETFTLDFYVPEGVQSAGGYLSFDSRYVEYVSFQNLGVFNGKINENNMKFGGIGEMTDKQVNVYRFTFKAKTVGITTISVRNADLSSDSGNIPVAVIPKRITIKPTPSSNNNLSSLSVSVGAINFNKDVTSYNLNVDSDVSEVVINASVEDKTAVLTGTGTKSLSYGNNVLNVVVRAENGSEKTYTININRKDIRSDNNALSSLSVNDGELSPAFNKGTIEYYLSVPYEVNVLSVNATAEDDKAKVNISNTNLLAEKTTDVKISVTAENGSVRTYTIHTTRGKDPNKVLSTDNYLESLTVSDGILSPSFQQDRVNYIVYLPFEINEITINYTLSEKEYATSKKEGPDKLSVGNNLYKISVTAEDESVREYNITVVRGVNLLEGELNSNVYLKEIKINNGKLNQFFNKTLHYYTYSGVGAEITAIPEDENASVKIIKTDGLVTIIVESPSGEVGVYTLNYVKHGTMRVVITVVSFILAIIASYFVGHFISTKHIINPIVKKIKHKRTKE